MFRMLLKILRTPKTVVAVTEFSEQTELLVLGKKIQSEVNRLFHGSLAIRQIDGGSDNACEQELVALSNSFYDLDRFGIHFVASPKHADMLMVTGPITRNMTEAVRRAYNNTPDPKIVVAVGNEAINGGIFKGSYAIADKVSDVIPVDYGIPGNPPSPKTILVNLLRLLETRVNKNKIK